MNRKRLFRSKNDRIIGGVSGGLADYFDLDPIIIRVVFVVTTIGWGVGLLAYLLLWIIVPEKQLQAEEIFNEEENGEKVHEKRKTRNYSNLFGAILIFIGFMFLLDNMIGDIRSEYIYAIIIIGIGLFIVLSSYGRFNLNGDKV